MTADGRHGCRALDGRQARGKLYARPMVKIWACSVDYFEYHYSTRTKKLWEKEIIRAAYGENLGVQCRLF
jgi:hypothetical protein